MRSTASPHCALYFFWCAEQQHIRTRAGMQPYHTAFLPPRLKEPGLAFSAIAVMCELCSFLIWIWVLYTTVKPKHAQHDDPIQVINYMCALVVFVLILTDQCESDLARTGMNIDLFGGDHPSYMVSEYIMQCNKSYWLVCNLLPASLLLCFSAAQLLVTRRVPFVAILMPCFVICSVVGVSFVVLFNHRGHPDPNYRDAEYAGHLLGVFLVAVCMPVEFVMIVFDMFGTRDGKDGTVYHARNCGDLRLKHWAVLLLVVFTLMTLLIFVNAWISEHAEAVVMEYVWVVLLFTLLLFHSGHEAMHIDQRNHNPWFFVTCMAGYALLYVLFRWLLPVWDDEKKR